MHHLRIFLSSPGDVHRERQLAREVIDQIQSERLYRDRLKLEVVAWDKPGAGTAMSAHLEPQEAIDRGLKKPSQCDIVIVIFWARMGTPLSEKHLKPDRSRYRSGTEYEFFDALNAARSNNKPDVLVYRRKKPPDVNLADPERKEKERQWDLVEEFFTEFRNPDGSYRSYYEKYDEPSDFKDLLAQNLRDLITKYNDAHPSDKSAVPVTTEAPTWKDSPFPGLRAFTPEEAPIFYGRGREIDALISKLSEPSCRIISVVGASGTGKSSLVAAGVIPALKKDAIPGSKDWIRLRFTPAELSDNPFNELVNAFKPILHKHGRPLRKQAEDLETNPNIFREMVPMALEGKPAWAELLLFIDQFEELFTLVDPKYQPTFIDLLAEAAQTARLRTVITMRADFYHRCLEWPVLDALLAESLYTLLAPKTGALYEMITRPVELAGLRFEEGLPERILDDTGMEPGSLPILAFVLQRMFDQRDGHELSEQVYDGFGGLDGAVTDHVKTVERELHKEFGDAVDDRLPKLFQALLVVDPEGLPTRRRALRIGFDEDIDPLVESLIKARLLSTEGEGEDSTVSVAHEKLFEAWPTLAHWIAENQDDLRVLRQAEIEAREWAKHNYDLVYLWHVDRLKRLHEIVLHLDGPAISDAVRCFAQPQKALVDLLDTPILSHQERLNIGLYLSELVDPRPGVGIRTDGLPDIAWCEVPEGEITLEEGAGTFSVDPFYISKYPVTWIQYRSFVNAKDGYQNEHWWKGLVERKDEPGDQYRKFDNHPAENVSWYDAVAFCRWLTERLGYEIRLPTEWEWQQAATGGDPANTYPWGADWNPDRANTAESGLSRSTAVGLYPQGLSPVRVHDMSGNVWEWCLNEHEKPDRIDVAGDADRAVRGGSWFYDQFFARCAYRSRYDPYDRDYGVGFRLLCSSPIF